jgi:hypothetical protein
MLVPPEIQKCCFFIGYRGKTKEVWGGTAFAVGLELDVQSKRSMLYLVTAKHCIVRIRDEHRQDKILVRANLAYGAAGTLTSDVSDWELHPREDIAVLEIPYEWTEIVDFAFLQEVLFATDEAIKTTFIGEGDEIFITGLFRRHYGKNINRPVTRIGNIAMMPSSEPVPSAIGDIHDAYVIEIKSIGGLSGSPTFFHMPQRDLAGVVPLPVKSLYYLIGMVHGHWDIPAEAFTDFDVADDKNSQNEKINMGMAIVIPCQKIMAFIKENESFKTTRAELERKEREKDFPTLD